MKNKIISSLLFLVLAFQSSVLPCYATEQNNADLIHQQIIERIASYPSPSGDNPTYNMYFTYDDSNHITGYQVVTDNFETTYTYTYNDDGTFSESTETRVIPPPEAADDGIEAFSIGNHDSFIDDLNLRNLIGVYQELWNIANNSPTLTVLQKTFIKNQTNIQANLARADYCVAYPKSSFAYYFLPYGTQNTGTAFTRTITPAMSNEFSVDVMAVQRALILEGFLEPTELDESEYGYYNQKTQDAVNAFQLSVLGFCTGVIALLTLKALFNNPAAPPPDITITTLRDVNVYRQIHDNVRDTVKEQITPIYDKVWKEEYLPKAGIKGNGGRFDLAARPKNPNESNEVWEVKHDGPYGNKNGPTQLESYMKASQDTTLCPKKYPFIPLMNKGKDIQPGELTFNSKELVTYYSKADPYYEGLIFYSRQKNTKPAYDLDPIKVLVPGFGIGYSIYKYIKEQYSNIPRPSPQHLKMGLLSVGITVAAVFVLKTAVAVLLSPSTGGASFFVYAL